MAALVGLAPLLAGSRDPIVLLGWLAIVAFPLGVLCGATGLRFWPYVLGASGVWMAALAWLESTSGGVVPAPVWTAACWTGLAGLGVALGALVAQPFRAAALALVLTGSLSLAPTAVRAEGGLGRLDPGLAALALDASPVTLVLETAGLDWMRHRAVYEPAGTEWFSDRRRPYRGPLAAPVVLVLGCLGVFLTRSRVRAAWEGLPKREGRPGRPG